MFFVVFWLVFSLSSLVTHNSALHKLITLDDAVGVTTKGV